MAMRMMPRASRFSSLPRWHPPLLLVFTAPVFLLTSPAPAGAQEQSAQMAYLSPLFPPNGVTVQFRGKRATVTWKPIHLDRLSNYEIYRWSGLGEQHWEKIGSTAAAEFVDKKAPSKNSRYKVVAVDRYGNRSSLAQSEVSAVVAKP
jgi:hypothetical protein